ncbi:MAG TPA: 3-hydroxyacyl-CoA dehydrogenase NAD-binding domain-containing protein [Candidatus Sulfopaludibacter sp.]|jgi:3-hydroxyacyl-CoA dehydrogenase|nr:3-hydroxyacyl-CoA dehydrogenase NAD-binding domain-containing protein [Candidatus Sulfopaludibacter sp.]
MSTFIHYSRQDDVAVLTIDNPPVNAMSPGVPEALEAALDQAADDPVVRAIVVIGAGRTFIAGADIGVLEDMAWGRRPPMEGWHGLLAKLEASPKPLVMAIHGSALGGGLEVAMAGHYRVAVATAQLGQPEVELGIMPGAEGTQRLPRLVGVEKALEMCIAGKPVKAAEALSAGLIDAVMEGDLLAGAVAFARNAGACRKTSERADRLGNPEANAPLFAAGLQLAAKVRRNQEAPLRVVQAIEAATTLPFEEGCRLERELFRACLVSDQAKALMHVFFAERMASKVPGVDKNTTVYPVARAGIVGAGTMGGGIAMCFANAGIPVLLKETTAAALDAGMARIRQNYENSRKRGRFTAEEVERRLALIHPQLDWSGFDAVDLTLEAVFESMSLKKQIFAELDRVARPGCVLATNTSTLSIDEIAAVTARPEFVIGMHFFSPANVMRLLEVVRGSATSLAVIATAMALAKQLRKVAVLVGNCPGFVGNRMFFPYMYEGQFLAEDGATPQQVDRVLTNFGMAMGIFAVDDLAGIDVGWRVRQELTLGDPGGRQPRVADRLYAMGRYGQKTGKGWYLYGEDRKPVADPEVVALIEAASAEAGIARRSIGDQEILERSVYALVNEGARILEEGFAQRASDIDVVYVNGYGFPSWRGGPMFYADTVGLDKVLAAVEGFGWKPAPLLQRLAAEGKTFREGCATGSRDR